MKVNFDKGDGLVPAIIQDAETRQVLMLAYMNKAALEKTQAEGRVTFFSRSKNRLWTKGETSGNFLNLVDLKLDCDQDTLLIRVNPVGPACHTGSDTCFNEVNQSSDFIAHLEQVILDRKNNPSEKSYTASLFKKGINKIAQKVGEEAVELVIEAKDDDKGLFLNEAADLTFHLLVLLAEKGYAWEEVLDILRARHK